MTRREWLRTGLRWGGLGLVAGVVGLLAARSGGATARTANVCSGCRWAGRGCSPQTNCRLSPPRTKDLTP